MLTRPLLYTPAYAATLKNSNSHEGLRESLLPAPIHLHTPGPVCFPFLECYIICKDTHLPEWWRSPWRVCEEEEKEKEEGERKREERGCPVWAQTDSREQLQDSVRLGFHCIAIWNIRRFIHEAHVAQLDRANTPPLIIRENGRPRAAGAESQAGRAGWEIWWYGSSYEVGKSNPTEWEWWRDRWEMWSWFC